MARGDAKRKHWRKEHDSRSRTAGFHPRNGLVAYMQMQLPKSLATYINVVARDTLPSNSPVVKNFGYHMRVHKPPMRDNSGIASHLHSAMCYTSVSLNMDDMR